MVKSGEIQFLDGHPIYVHPGRPLPESMLKFRRDEDGKVTTEEIQS
jgi:hypothetical protein